MADEFLRAIVWTDYRLAVLFTLVLPIVLLIWAFVQKADAIVRLLIIYWRVSSLLPITIYLLIASWPIGFVAGFCARILIPIALWFWVDLNEDINDRPAGLLKLILTAWRWAITLYCTLSAFLAIGFLRCAFAAGAISSQFCQVGLEPPFLFKQYFHPNSKPELLGFLGIVSLLFYIIYLAYFVLIRLGKQGRSAMEQ